MIMSTKCRCNLSNQLLSMLECCPFSEDLEKSEDNQWQSLRHTVDPNVVEGCGSTAGGNAFLTPEPVEFYGKRTRVRKPRHRCTTETSLLAAPSADPRTFGRMASHATVLKESLPCLAHGTVLKRLQDSPFSLLGRLVRLVSAYQSLTSPGEELSVAVRRHGPCKPTRPPVFEICLGIPFKYFASSVHLKTHETFAFTLKVKKETFGDCQRFVNR